MIRLTVFLYLMGCIMATTLLVIISEEDEQVSAQEKMGGAILVVGWPVVTMVCLISYLFVEWVWPFTKHVFQFRRLG